MGLRVRVRVRVRVVTLTWVCSPIRGEISPQIAVTKPGVFRKTMSSEVEG